MRLVSGAPPELSQRWASVLFSVGAFWARERPGPHAAMLVEGIAKRLTFDNALSLEIRTILAQHQTLTASTLDWTDAAVRRMVRELDPFCAQTLRFARHVDQILGSGARKEWLGDFETRMADLEKAGNLRPELPRGIGKTIVETFGLKPGPDVGRRKDFLEFSLLDGLISEAKEAQFYMDYLNEHFRDDAEE
jgi:poly(A) polymerase